MNEYLTKKDITEKVLAQGLYSLKYIKRQKNTIEEGLLRGIVSNIQGTILTIETIIEAMKGSEKFTDSEIVSMYEDIISNNEEPMSYKNMEDFGFVRGDNIPFKNLKEEINYFTLIIRLENSGISKTKTGFKLSPPKFADYTYSRVNIVCTSTDDFYVYCKKGVYKAIDKDELSRIVYYLMNEISNEIWKTSFETQAVRAIQMSCPHINVMNENRNLINLSNGIFNLETFELIPHSPEYYTSIRIDINYNEKADCPRFLLYMDQITCGKKALQMVLQELMGYCLTAETRAEKAFILYGRGSNGKSVFAKIITMLAGEENVSNIPLKHFNDKFGLETLENKTVNIATETEVEGFKFNTEGLKSSTSGDRMHLQRKFKKGKDVIPIAKMIFLTNNLPIVSDTTKGYLRKIHIIPFNAEFKSDSTDANYKLDNTLIEKLQLEKEGILQYALEGLKRLKENNYQFTKCDVIDDALVNYEKEINPTIEFFEDNIEICPGGHTHRPDVFKKFKEWLVKTGKLEWTNIKTQQFWTMFEQTMAKNGIKYETKKINGHMKVLGIKFKDTLNCNDFNDLTFDFGN